MGSPIVHAQWRTRTVSEPPVPGSARRATRRGSTPGPSRHSAGLLVFRRTVPVGRDASGSLEVLLVHPGGPYWARKDLGSWSIPKGEARPEDSAELTAEREFTEELGQPPPSGSRQDLGEVTQSGGKHVRAWAVEGEVDLAHHTSNTFEMEWPPRSGTVRSFPEIDQAQWFSLNEAHRRILSGQRPLLDRLESLINEA